MLPLFQFVFIFSALFPSMVCEMKMVLMDGKVTYGRFPIKYSPSDDCIQSCFDKDDCMLSWKISNGSCVYYTMMNRPTTINVTRTKLDGNYVAIKSHVPANKCPKSVLDMDMYMTTPWNDTYSWTPTPDGWSLNGCRDGWKRFERESGTTVCMNAIRWDTYTNRADSVKLCTDKKASLSGIASMEENQWVYDEVVRVREQSSLSSYWVDGEVTCTNRTCDWTTLVHSDGYTLTTERATLESTNTFDTYPDPNPERKCLAVAFFETKPETRMYGGDCRAMARGSVCGYELRDTV